MSQGPPDTRRKGKLQPRPGVMAIMAIGDPGSRLWRTHHAETGPVMGLFERHNVDQERYIAGPER